MKLLSAILITLCFFATASYSSLRKVQPEKSVTSVPYVTTKKTVAADEFSGNSANGDDKRNYTSGRYGLMIGSTFAGWLHSFSGGEASTDVVTEKTGADQTKQKHIGDVKYSPISFACGSGMSKDFYQWIKDLCENKNSRKDGAVIVTDATFKEKERTAFTKGLLTEVVFPALDASSKDAAKMTIKIKPEVTQHQKNDGMIYTNDPSHKQWNSANFRLKINGLDHACMKVSKIDAITIKQKTISGSSGERMPANVEVSNLVITLPESEAQDFMQWQTDIVKQKNNGPKKDGTLEYLDKDAQTTLFTLNFRNLGIFKITPVKSATGAKWITVEMYNESIKFDAPGAGW